MVKLNYYAQLWSVMTFNQTALLKQTVQFKRKTKKNLMIVLKEIYYLKICHSLMLSWMFHLTLYNALITMLVLAKMRLWPSEVSTRLQRKSKDWFKERQKRLTSSSFGRVSNWRESIAPVSIDLFTVPSAILEM